MEKLGFNSVDDLRTEAKRVGISDSRLDKAITFNSLPTSGTFTDVGVVENKETDPTDATKVVNNFSHIVLITNTGERVSMSALQASAHFGAEDTAKFIKSQKEGAYKGKYFLRGDVLNKHLTGDQAERAFALKGKKFTSSEEPCLVLPFKAGGYTEAQAKQNLVPKKLYKVTLDVA